MCCIAPRHPVDDFPDRFVYLPCLQHSVQIFPPHHHDLGLSTVIRVHNQMNGLDMVRDVLGREPGKGFSNNIFFREFRLEVPDR